jgi:hypothetical protein
MKQTAVDFVVEQLSKEHPIYTKNDTIKKAKEMEKQQIIDAHLNGHNAPSSTLKHFDAKQYYNETFKI